MFFFQKQQELTFFRRGRQGQATSACARSGSSRRCSRCSSPSRHPIPIRRRTCPSTRPPARASRLLRIFFCIIEKDTRREFFFSVVGVTVPVGFFPSLFFSSTTARQLVGDTSNYSRVRSSLNCRRNPRFFIHQMRK